MRDSQRDLDDPLAVRLRTTLGGEPDTFARGGDPLPGILARARPMRRRRTAAAAGGTLLAVAAVAGIGIGLVHRSPTEGPSVATVPTQSASPTPPTSSPTPSADPTSSATGSADIAALLLRPSDLPANPYNDGPPTLRWQTAASTGAGRCLTGHLPSDTTTVGAVDLVAPTGMPGPDQVFRYRQTVLDAGTAAGARSALDVLANRIEACGTHRLAVERAESQSAAAWVTWDPDPTPGQTTGPDTRDDEYVAVHVAGRYVLTLSLEVHENGSAELSHAVGQPLARAAERG